MDGNFAFGGFALKLFFEGEIVVAPNDGSDFDVGHAIGKDCVARNVVDLEADKFVAGVEETKAVATGELLGSLDGEAILVFACEGS